MQCSVSCAFPHRVVRRLENPSCKTLEGAWGARLPDVADLRGTRLRCKIRSYLLRNFQPISQIFANLRGLYLGCIEADFCNQILILQRFSRSTRISFLCTAPISKSLQIFVEKFLRFSIFRSKFFYFLQFSSIFAPILMKISRNFAKLRRDR